MSKGSILITEGECNNSKAYVIITGKLGIVKQLRNDRPSVDKNQIIKAKNKLKTIVSMVGLMNTVKKKNAEATRKKCGLTPPSLNLTARKLTRQDSGITSLYEADAFSDVDKWLRTFIEKHGKLVDITGHGHIIGEFALVNDNARTATVIAMENSHLMVFSKECFEDIKANYTGEFIERKNLIRRVFPSISSLQEGERLNRIARMFKPLSISLVRFFNSE